MYGLINLAVHDLIRKRFGTEAWEAIRRDAGVEEDAFIGMQSYPDEVTYALVASASRCLGLPATTLLEAFGEHWIRYTASEGYGSMLDLAGTSFLAFVQNLDRLHTHVAAHMPALVPPSFRTEVLGEGHLRLHYYSKRQGLAPMVVGLVKGLAARFGQVATVSLVTSTAEGADHDTFDVVYHPVP